jgi:hypothetical protein
LALKGFIMVRRFIRAGSACAALFFSIHSAHAAMFAQYVDGTYTLGTVPSYLTSFNDPTVLNNTPQGETGVPDGFPGVVSPFNPPFDNSQIVLIGLGGGVTVHFATPVSAANSPAIGIFSNVGLIDSNYPAGQADNPADIFGGGSAVVSVSADGSLWKNLGIVNFTMPENYYLNAGPYDLAAPANPQVADFGKPFTGTLSSFDNETYPQIVTTLNGSAGGTWLDPSSTGLSQISYVRFDEDATQLPVGSYLALQAISANDTLPEPASIATLALGAGFLLRRRRCRA